MLLRTLFSAYLEKIVVALSGFVITVFIAKEANPEFLGNWRLLLSGQTILSYICGLGFSNIIVRFSASEIKRNIYEDFPLLIFYLFLISFTLSSFICILLFWLSEVVEIPPVILENKVKEKKLTDKVE